MDELFIECRNSDGIKNFVKSYDGDFSSFGNFTRYGTALQDCADECNKETSCLAFRHERQWSASMRAMVGVCHGYYNKESPATMISRKHNTQNKDNLAYVKCINGRYIIFLYEMLYCIELIWCYVHIIHI